MEDLKKVWIDIDTKEQSTIRAGQLLKQRREELKLTQTDVMMYYGTDRTGKPIIPIQQVSRIERGFYKEPSLSDLCLLAHILKLDIRTVASWYGYWQIEDKFDEKIAEILVVLRDLPEKVQQAVINLLHTIAIQTARKR